MPQILELREIDGDIWARVGKPPDFPSGVALWTPAEQAHERKLAARDAIEAMWEPTPEMIIKGDCCEGADGVAEAVWQAMIDEMLKG